MREADLHRHIYQRSRDLPACVLLGPGDDCACVAVGEGPADRPGNHLLLTVDHLVEDRHYAGPLGGSGKGPSGGTTVDAAARKAIARSVSDIAAMGGRPMWSLATGALPEGLAEDVADRLFDAMSRWARHWGCPLVGGDIATLPAIGGRDDEPAGGQADHHTGPALAVRCPTVLTVTVAGVPHGKRGAVPRSGAGAGDGLWVTGRIGGSLASGRHLSFEPRLAEAAWLCDTLGNGLAAMIDVSDGVGIDAGRLAEASSAGAGTQGRVMLAARMESRLLPLHNDVIDWRAAIADGEDYELLFAVRPEAEGLLPERCPVTGTRLTRIGRFVAHADVAPTGGGTPNGSSAGGSPGCWAVVVDEKGVETDASAMGWDHGTASVQRTRA